MSKKAEEKPVVSEEERKNNRNSFIIGIFIGLAIIIIFVIFFNH